MALFKKRETLTQNIAYLGIMAAINVVSVVLINYVLPILFIPFVLIMPFTSTVVTLFCKKRYFIFYAIATTGICLLVTMNNFSDTLFYVVPSIISGFIFGLFLIYRLPTILAILMAALANLGITYLSIPLIELIYQQNIIYVIATIFGLENYIYLDFVTPTFILVISVIQEALTFAIIQSEIPKLGVKEEEKHLPFLNDGIALLASIMALVCYLTKYSIFSTFTYFFLTFTLFFAIYDVLLTAFNKQFKVLIIYGVLTLLSIIAFAFLYQYVEPPFNMLLSNILFTMIIFTSLVNNCLTKIHKSVE